MSQKKLKRSANKKWLGVCGGLAEYFDIDVTVFRILCVLLILFTGLIPGIIIYLIIAMIMPKHDSAE